MKSFSEIICRALLLLTVLCLGSCREVLEYPEEPAVDPTLMRTTVELRTDFSTITDPIYATYSYSEPRDGGGYDVRYIIEIYALSGSDAGKRVVRHVETSDVLPSSNDTYTATFDLHAGEYEVLGWIDFVPRGTEEDHLYATDNLHVVGIKQLGNGEVDAEDAFAGCNKLNIEYHKGCQGYFGEASVVVDMERPHGKFRIVTTDVKKFLDTYKPTHGSYADAVPAQTVLRYTCYMPTAYRLDTRLGDVSGMQQGVRFTMPTVKENENEMTLASDYVVVTNDNTTVSVDIEVRNAAGERLNGVGGIRIPIQRNKLTIIKGEFLTLDIPGNGGGIDDSFEDEFVIIIPN